jgi:hypothetical protein
MQSAPQRAERRKSRDAEFPGHACFTSAERAAAQARAICRNPNASIVTPLQRGSRARPSTVTPLQRARAAEATKEGRVFLLPRTPEELDARNRMLAAFQADGAGDDQSQNARAVHSALTLLDYATAEHRRTKTRIGRAGRNPLGVPRNCTRLRSGDVKPQYIPDLAFQVHLARASGLQIDEASIIISIRITSAARNWMFLASSRVRTRR